MKLEQSWGGQTVTNGQCAVRLTNRHESGGWVGIYISLSGGRLTGTDCLLEDERLSDYEPVAWEWTPLPGSGIEHRYVWSKDWRSLEHEIRTAVPV